MSTSKDQEKKPTVAATEAEAGESALDLSEQQRIRREKLARLQAEGRDPFAIVRFEQTHHSAAIKAAFESSPETIENKDVSVAGRMMSFRDIGKASFVDLQDRDGRIQIYINAEDLGAEEYGRIKTFDRGDIIGVEGFVFRTRRGEISVHAKKITLLTKALEPLPEKYHGLKDPEIRYRRRYLDLVMNPEV
ncbi:MAG TPA: OB-fold nucleic acid binding domain-containing protein, partial [Rectinemataceae bacterium]|nr:OB-fold nucleic acid binding domain-containing protein [Rectinemataceae bacterium]